jgi:serine/threonine-protein kinase
LPSGERFTRLRRPVLALSSDGSRIAVVGVGQGKQQIYIRPLNGDELTRVPGAQDARSPFFSPDGKWLGFEANGKLMKVPVHGGVPLSICEVGNTRGLSGVTWGDNDTIVFAPQFGVSGLVRVSAAGGTPQALTSRDPDSEEEGQRWPQLLPGGQAVLFTAWRRNLDDAQIVVQRLDTRERRVILRGGTYARYVNTGHIVYARAGALIAVPFDLARLELTGDPVAVAKGVALHTEGVAQFDVSNTGTLVYVPGGIQGTGSNLVWVDRSGAEQPVGTPAGAYLNGRLSPDGQQLAVVVQGATDDIFVYNISRQTFTRQTVGARSLSPIWTPDGTRIIYRSERAGHMNLFWRPADGSGEEERLTVSPDNQVPFDVSPDGHSLVFGDVRSGKGSLQILSLTSDKEIQSLLETLVFGASFSPDGRWLAYGSSESGQPEIWVRPFPTGPGKRQISTEGGSSPYWTRSGALFYLNGNKMMAVDLATEPTLTVSRPHVLFEREIELLLSFNTTPAGQRFLMVRTSEQEQAILQLKVVLNWSEELKQRVPTK